MNAPRGAAGTAAGAILAHASRGILGLRPYEPGKPPEELERELGVRDAVKLASNENPLGASPLARAAAERVLARLGVYPDGNGYRLKRVLADRLGVAPEQIVLGNGSNDVLDLLARVFLRPGTEAVYSQHAFAVYRLVTRAVDAEGIEVPARDYGHDLDAMLAAVGPRTRLVFIANPNNPTGTWLGGERLRAFLAALPPGVVAVVDEAYFEYVTEPDYPDASRWLAEFPHLVVTRSFSKAYGLAALRVGYGLCHAAVADLLNRVRQPFNVNAVALAAAEAALQDEDFVAESRRVNREGLELMTAECRRLGLDCIPSVGNFLAIDVGGEAAPVYEALLREGVIVRPIAGYGLPQHLRVTIGTPAQIRRVAAALSRVLEHR